MFETILGRRHWHFICLLMRNLCRLLDTMNTTLTTTNSLPIEHWRSYLLLAQKGMLHLDQMIQKSDQLKKEGQLEDALTLCKAYIEHTKHGDQDMALFNYGAMLQAANQLDDAEASYRQCIEISSRLPQARINLGLLLEKKGNSLAAVEQWQAVATLPQSTESDISNIVLALNHLGRVYENHKFYDLAENALEESLKLNPKQPGVIQHWVHIRQKSCKWPVYKDLPNISQNEMLMATSPLAMLALTDDPVQQLLTAYTFVERTYGFKEEFLCKDRRYQHDRLRIGYVSGDLCVHAVGLLLAELLEGHDRTKFEIYGYDFSPEDGTPHRARLKQAFDHLRPIHQLNDRQVAELVLADEIDVLIDLHGLSSGARPGIFALHPAPKQGTYLGFIGTTGMPWFDFVIADEFVLPKELKKYFTEKEVLYVDGSFIPMTTYITPTKEVTRTEYGLPENAFVMAAFGNVYKITQEMFETWLVILEKIPNAILWLIDDNPVTTKNLKDFANLKDADISRVIFSPRAAHQEYKAKLKLANVFLDTYPYNCGSTSNDVINAGIPLLTLYGQSMVSRMGMSILKKINCSELISYSHEEYVNICKKLNDSEDFRKNINTKIFLNQNCATIINFS